MNTYTEKQTLEFKRKRNAERNYSKAMRKGFWVFSVKVNRWVHSVSRRQGIFNPATKCMTILSA